LYVKSTNRVADPGAPYLESPEEVPRVKKSAEKTHGMHGQVDKPVRSSREEAG
jgi:hypothetical protein